MYELHGCPGSGSAIIELTLCELGQPHKSHTVSLKSDDQRSGQYARLNPQQKIPALVTEDGTVITESVAILLWLLESHPGTALLPATGTPDRAWALRWLLFMAAELYPIIEILDYPERFAPDHCDPEALRSRSLDHWHKRWKIVETHLRKPWLAGEEFSICDIYLAVVSRWAGQSAWVARNLPGVERITRAVSIRPKCKTAWDRHFGNLR